MIIMDDLFKLMKAKNASDIHLTVGVPPVLRIQGRLYATQFEPLTKETAQTLIYSILSDEQRQQFEEKLELDCSIGLKSLGRLRVNIYKQKGCVAAAFRSIPTDFKTFEQLNLPPLVYNIMKLNQGLVLVTGCTGSGKSTSLASMINYLNMNESNHIMTVEDPIELVHPHKRSIVNQREVGADTHSFADALKHFLRQDPDIILVGELRDRETMEACLTLAETGHLVLSTLHTQTAPMTISRIIDSFPEGQKGQIRQQLANSLKAVISQQLIPTVNGKGRVLAVEYMTDTPGVKNLIREEKEHQLYGAMQTAQLQGMQTMDQALIKLCREQKISKESVLEFCVDDKEVRRLLSTMGY